MESITAQEILNQILTVRWAINHLPYKMVQCIKDDLFGGDNISTWVLDNTCLETPGDLQELHLLCLRDYLDTGNKPDTRMSGFISLVKTAMNAWTIIHAHEFKEIRAFREFKEEYPNLANSILVWGWG